MKKQNINILIVDDEYLNVLLLENYFKNTKYNVHISNSGTDALKKIQSILPDLILLDIRMPDVDGFQVLNNVKKNKKTKSIPIIMLTAFTSKEYHNKSINLGASGFMTKPINFKMLMDKIGSILVNRNKNT